MSLVGRGSYKHPKGALTPVRINGKPLEDIMPELLLGDTQNLCRRIRMASSPSRRTGTGKIMQKVGVDGSRTVLSHRTFYDDGNVL